MRCRHCGVTFSSARPEDQATYQNRTALEDRLPQVRRRIIWLFCLSVVPFFAPVCMRLKTYVLPEPPQISDYVARVSALPGVQAWIDGALAEGDFLDFEEPYRLHR